MDILVILMASLGIENTRGLERCVFVEDEKVSQNM